MRVPDEFGSSCIAVPPKLERSRARTVDRVSSERRQSGSPDEISAAVEACQPSGRVGWDASLGRFERTPRARAYGDGRSADGSNQTTQYDKCQSSLRATKSARLQPDPAGNQGGRGAHQAR